MAETLIDELVEEIADKAEDSAAYKKLKSQGVNPFRKQSKVADVYKASEISSFILQELTKKVDGCDSSFANLVFLQTEEGVRDLQRKIKSKEALNTGEGGFFRSELSSEKYNPEDIISTRSLTDDESKAVGEFVEKLEHKTDDKLNNNAYAQKLYLQTLKAQDALKGNGTGSFTRKTE
jgi:hypothetical protein